MSRSIWKLNVFVGATVVCFWFVLVFSGCDFKDTATKIVCMKITGRQCFLKKIGVIRGRMLDTGDYCPPKKPYATRP